MKVKYNMRLDKFIKRMLDDPIKVNNDKILDPLHDDAYKFKKHLFVKNDSNYDPKNYINHHNISVMNDTFRSSKHNRGFAQVS